MGNKMTKNGSFMERGELRSKSLIFLALFAVLVGLTGGASRYDALQIVPLRTLSCFALIPIFYYLSVREIKRESLLLIAFGSLVLLTVLQLIPLPPSVWHSFAGREAVSQIDDAVGLQQVWRPLTLTPTRTWNALGGLLVPGVGLLLGVCLGASSKVLLQLIAGLGVLNAFLGLMQLMSGRFSPLYLYEVTNRGGVVGIFANENHAAIFAACSMLVLTKLGLTARANRNTRWENLLYPSAFSLILLTALMGGSRAGFAAALGAVLISFGMLLLAPRLRRDRSVVDPIRDWVERHPRLMVLLPFVIIVMTVMLFITLGRAAAFADFLEGDSFADLRWSLWPVLGDMVRTHWLFGTGFGSFEQVYKMYEPVELLMPRYVNQAHNDWVQLLIEGGVVAGFLLSAVLMWLVVSISRMARVRSHRATALFWFGIFAILGGASLIDYPIRTPIFQVVGIWLLLALSRNCSDLKAT